MSVSFEHNLIDIFFLVLKCFLCFNLNIPRQIILVENSMICMKYDSVLSFTHSVLIWKIT